MDRPRKGRRQGQHTPIHLGKLLGQKSGQKRSSGNGRWIQVQPSGAGRIDIGLILRDVSPDARLESAAGFNALFTHRVRLSSTSDVDAQLIGWLQRAYDRA